MRIGLFGPDWFHTLLISGHTTAPLPQSAHADRDLRSMVRLDIYSLLQSGPEAGKFPALPDPRRFSVVERQIQVP